MTDACETCNEPAEQPVWHNAIPYHERCLPSTWNSRRLVVGPGNMSALWGPNPGGRKAHHLCYPFDEEK